MKVATKKQVYANSTEQAVTDIVKQKRSRPDLSEMMTPHTEPGEVATMMRNALEISSWPSIDTNSAEQVAERIRQYHVYCLEHDMKPDMSGMAMALGTFRQTLWRWENGIESNKPAGVRDAIKKGREMNENIMVQMMQNGKLNPVTAIFLLKNNHGYKDQQDVVITPNTPAEGRDPEEIRRQYRESLPESTENQ